MEVVNRRRHGPDLYPLETANTPPSPPPRPGQAKELPPPVGSRSPCCLCWHTEESLYPGGLRPSLMPEWRRLAGKQLQFHAASARMEGSLGSCQWEEQSREV